MNEYTIIITETLKRQIVISAEDYESAYEAAENMVNDGDVILTDEDFYDRDIEVLDI